MYMIKIRYIFVVLLALTMGACSNVGLELMDEQRESIVKYLTTKHSPKLISQKDVAESLEDDPEFYTVINNNTYRYIADYYNPDRQDAIEAQKGDALLLTFWCYDFSTYSTPGDNYLYFTNDPLYESTLEEAGLNTEYWNFEPKRVVLGKSDILNTIEKALVGCKEGDFVEIYLTYDAAYGKNWIGVTNLREPVAFFCTIDSIEN